MYLLACGEASNDNRNNYVTFSDSLQYANVLSKVSLCQCVFGQWPEDIIPVQVEQCIADRLRQADLKVVKIDLFDTKERVEIIINTGFDTLSFETTYFQCSNETFGRIPRSSIIEREPDNPDSWLEAKEYDTELKYMIHSYIYRIREDTNLIYEPAFLNERPRRSKIVLEIRGGNVDDTLTYTEHRAEYLNDIRKLLRQELESNPKLQHDTGRIIVNIIFYENDQLRSYN